MKRAGKPSSSERVTMPDLLFEIGTEELPDWYQEQAAASLERLLVRALTEAGVSHGPARHYSTARRLAVTVRDVGALSERRTEKRRGPPAAVAFDEAGQP